MLRAKGTVPSQFLKHVSSRNNKIQLKYAPINLGKTQWLQLFEIFLGQTPEDSYHLHICPVVIAC